MGIIMNVKKIRRLMQKFGLKCPIRKANPYRRMAKAIKTNAIADNLLKREFRVHGPRKVFLTDITYIPFNNAFVYIILFYAILQPLMRKKSGSRAAARIPGRQKRKPARVSARKKRRFVNGRKRRGVGCVIISDG